MSIAMIIATAATLYVAGQHEINSAADAAKALEPVAGSSASVLFAIGLLGASMLAGGVLPLATSYAISEAFGIPKGVNLDYRRGKVFFGLFTAFIALGAVVALIPESRSSRCWSVSKCSTACCCLSSLSLYLFWSTTRN